MYVSEREIMCVSKREIECVSEGERERESVCVSERERERESVCVCVCVCVCERERERERERVWNQKVPSSLLCLLSRQHLQLFLQTVPLLPKTKKWISHTYTCIQHVYSPW